MSAPIHNIAFLGIEEKVEYLKDLGISAIWLSPIFESPMVDFGYDVSDYYKIAQIFGTIDDFKSLKEKLDKMSKFILFTLKQLYIQQTCLLTCLYNARYFIST